MVPVAFVDITPPNMGDAASIACTVQPFSMSLGVGISALCLLLCSPKSIQAIPPKGAFELAFLLIGAVTCVSSAIFLRLAAKAGQEASGHIRSACSTKR